MTLKILSAALKYIVCFLLLSFSAVSYANPDLPAMMLLTGSISPGVGLNTTSARPDDQILAFSAVDGQLVGSGPVFRTGYLVPLTRTASFNGTPVVLELMQGLHRYELLQNGKPVWLRFEGKTLPDQFQLLLQVGIKTVDLLADDAKNPKAQRLSKRPELPCTPELDVNADGKCDDRDWAVLGLYGGGVTRSVARP